MPIHPQPWSSWRPRIYRRLYEKRDYPRNLYHKSNPWPRSKIQWISDVSDEITPKEMASTTTRARSQGSESRNGQNQGARSLRINVRKWPNWRWQDEGRMKNKQYINVCNFICVYVCLHINHFFPVHSLPISQFLAIQNSLKFPPLFLIREITTNRKG